MTRPVTTRDTARWRAVSQAAPASTTSIAGFQRASGTQLRAMAAPQVCATSSVSG